MYTNGVHAENELLKDRVSVRGFGSNLSEREGPGEFGQVLFPPRLRKVRVPAVPGLTTRGHREQHLGVLRPVVRIFAQAGEHQVVEFLWDRQFGSLRWRDRFGLHVLQITFMGVSTRTQ